MTNCEVDLMWLLHPKIAASRRRAAAAAEKKNKKKGVHVVSDAPAIEAPSAL